MIEDKLNFRGINDGITLEVESESLEKAKNMVDKKLRGNRSFYKGAKLLDIVSNSLDNIDVLALAFLLEYKYGFILELNNFNDRVLPKGQTLNEVKESLLSDFENLYDESKTKFINRTIRSGQSIDYDGSIVVIGDVNPGAIISAKYNIIVLGTFRGVGYAGKDGDLNSIVAAYKLEPTQLRIADKIARAPDEISERSHDNLPEIAKIIKNDLVIEPYLPNK